jgi:Flp pilus assembly protein TadG
MINKLTAYARRFSRADRGAVAVLSAFLIPAAAGFICLSAEFGRSLVVKVENQRIADSAAIAAANAYTSSGSTTTMTSVAQNVAALNGVAGTAATASIITSPRTAGSQAVRVVVSTQSPLYLASVVGFGNSVTVNSTAVAELGGAPACLLALSGSSSGVSLSGGTSISAPSCGVASNASVTVPCGTSITAKILNYNGSAPSIGCGGVTGPVRKAQTADPFAGHAGVSAASARATAAGSLAAPTIGAVTAGTNITFDYGTSAKTVVQAAGCTASFASPVWTVTCPAGGTYRFGSLSLGGGITVNFNTAGSATSAYTFSGTVNNSGSALNFGPGTYTMATGLRSGGGSTTTFGAGTFNIGRDTAKCSNVAFYSICNLGTTMTFGGPSTFVLTSGVYNKGGSTLTLGSGTTNSFNIGPASDSNAVNMGGGATTTFADATLFQIYGDITESGGACTTLSATPVHDIRGSLNLAGGLKLGAGLYAVSGYVALGASGGGNVTCNGASIGVLGTDVTFAVAATPTILGGGSCNGKAVCMGAGFSSVVLTAPTSGTYKDLVLVGPTSTSNSAGFTLNEGASTTLAGAVYVPNGSLALSGGASIGNVAGQCLQIVARDMTLSGGTSITSNACVSGATSGIVKLVQ